MQLNNYLFNVKIDDRIVVITFVATFFLERYLKMWILSKFGTLVYKDLMSRDAKFELSGIVSFVLVYIYIYMCVCVSSYIFEYFSIWTLLHHHMDYSNMLLCSILNLPSALTIYFLHSGNNHCRSQWKALLLKALSSVSSYLILQLPT